MNTGIDAAMKVRELAEKLRVRLPSLHDKDVFDLLLDPEIISLEEAGSGDYTVIIGDSELQVGAALAAVRYADGVLEITRCDSFNMPEIHVYTVRSTPNIWVRKVCI